MYSLYHSLKFLSWPTFVSYLSIQCLIVVISGMHSGLRSDICRHILHRGRFWAKSAASGSVRWCCFRSCLTVLSHVMEGRPSCLLQSAGGEANRILLASSLSSMRIICPNRVSRHDWIIAVSLGCFVSLRTSSFLTHWYHLMPGIIHRHHWSSASILRASVLDIAQQSEPYSVWSEITSRNPLPLKHDQAWPVYRAVHRPMLALALRSWNKYVIS